MLLLNFNLICQCFERHILNSINLSYSGVEAEILEAEILIPQLKQA